MNPPPGEIPPWDPPVRETLVHFETQKKWRPLFGEAARFLFLIIIACTTFLAGIAASGYVYFTRNLPSMEKLKNYSPPTVTQFYAANGELIGEFAVQRRYVVPMDQIPQTLKDAFIATEGKRFLKCRRMDWRDILRAFGRTWAPIGTTISRCVTKTFLLTPERRLRRKIKEAILCRRIEQYLGKEYILYLYLNQIYLGSGAYGVEAAARTYFDKSVKDLTIAECAMIAGLAKSHMHSPKKDLRRSLERRAYVLRRMLEQGFITRAQYNEAKQEEVKLNNKGKPYLKTAPDFVEHVRRYVVKKYGTDALYKEGLQVYTTVDPDLTEAARKAMDRGLRELDKRQGYRGPLKTVDADGVEKFIREKSRPLEHGLRLGEMVEGVVIRIDDESVHVRLGYIVEDGAREALIGQIKIDPDPNWWVRKPFIHPELRTRTFARGDLPFRVGDVILVRVIATDVQRREIDANKYGTFDPETNEHRQEGVTHVHLEPEQVPVVQSALMLRENRTGYIRVLIGGSRGSKPTYNRATQARRDAGTSFQPFIYAAAFSKGFSVSGTIEDLAAAVSDPPGTGEVLGFSNDGALHQDPITLRTAFVTSLNPPTMKLLQQIGVEYARSYARRLGYTSPLADNLTLDHGGAGVSLEEQLNAFAVYPNNGDYVPSIYVKKIVDRYGNVLEEHHAPVLSDDANQGNRPAVSTDSHKRNLPPAPGRSKVADSGTSVVRRGIDNAVAFTIPSMLRGVVQEGTGTVLKEIVGRPDIAGKTGTSKDCMNAWFVGFSPDYTCGVWVGFDEMKSIGPGESGASAAAPMWGYFMREVLKGTPVKEFPRPKSIEYCSDTGSPSTK